MQYQVLSPQKWIALAWCCLAVIYASPPSQEVAVCDGSMLLQLGSKPPEPSRIASEAHDHSFVAEPLGLASEASESFSPSQEEIAPQAHNHSLVATPLGPASQPFSPSQDQEASAFSKTLETAQLQVQLALSRAYQQLGARSISILAVIVAVGMLILCIKFNLQKGSLRTASPMQGGSVANHFTTAPAAGLVSRADASGRPQSPKTKGHAGHFIGLNSPVQTKTLMAQPTQTRSTRSPSSSAASSPSVRALCPGLIVPENSDCVLAIRILPEIAGIGDAAGGWPLASRRGALEFDILDSNGKPVLSACIAKPWPSPGEAVVTLRTLDASHAGPTAGDSGVLTLCRVGSNKTNIHIYDKDDILFGCIARDRSSSGYVLMNNCGECLLVFEGSFKEHKINVLQADSLMAHTETCKMIFDPDGQYYQARISNGVDVGLVLSGLLAIDCMQAA